VTSEYWRDVEYAMGPKRPDPPGFEIMDAIHRAAITTLGQGAKIRVTSGQEGDQPQHGSNRHKTGLAADFQVFRPDGTLVGAGDDDALNFASKAAQFGVRGIGAGNEYMGANTFHFDMMPHADYGPNQGPVWGSWAKDNRQALLQAMGLGPMEPGQQQPPMPGQTLSAQNTAQQPGIMEYLGNGLRKGLQNGDLMDRLALGFNTMRLEPDSNLAAGIRESMSDRRKSMASAGSANRTVAMLRNMKGPDGQPIPSALQAADLIEGNPESATSVLQSFYAGQMKAKTGLANRDYPNGLSVVTQNDGTKKYMKNGVVLSAPAEIEAAIQDTIRYDSELAGSNRQAVLNQDRAADIYSKIGLSRNSIQTTDRAIAAIDAGGITGFMADYFPNITQASAELANAMDTMGLDVISSVTFGALSEAEMRTAMNIGSPRSLAPADLRQWLVDKKDAQQKAMVALTKAARWFSKPGNTLDGWFDQQAQAGANPAAPGDQFATMSAQDISDYMNANLANMTTAAKAQALARLQELQRSQP
jgi:hypothetical protein